MKSLSLENFYIGKIHENKVSAMILQWHDKLFWPYANDNEAGYVHKLCVVRQYAGIGISDKMIDFAKEECRRRGIKYLRLDTGWNRLKLCHHYEKLGFIKVRKITLESKDYALYQMGIS